MLCAPGVIADFASEKAAVSLSPGFRQLMACRACRTEEARSSSTWATIHVGSH
jgi:hypothetical protein